MAQTNLDKALGRTLASLSRREVLLPHLERALTESDWPEEYPVKVYNKERKYDGYFHPSSDLGADELYLFYKFSQYHNLSWEPPSPSLVMTFQVGSALHSIVQSMLIHLGFTEEKYCEVSFVDEKRRVAGTLDVQKCFLPDGSTAPVEIKSCSNIPKSLEQYDRWHYRHQLQVYMDLGCGPEPAERGIFLFVEKTAPHRLREFVIYRDEKLLNEIYDKFDRVVEAVKNNDPSSLRDCCTPNSETHHRCSARNVCRIGPPVPVEISGRR